MKIFRIAAILVLLGAPLTANAEGFALTLKGGTLGFGLEGTKSLSSRTNLRVGINNYTYDFDATESGIAYDFELELRSYSLLFDWHPLASAFRVTAGLFSNKNEFNMGATSTGSQTIGNTTYTASEIGALSGQVSFKSGAPYIGVGWGNAVAKDKGFGFNVDLGVLFQGSPEVTLAATGTAASSGSFQSDLRREEQELEDDLDSFKTYPVVSFGVSYRF